jgi:ribosomal protein L15
LTLRIPKLKWFKRYYKLIKHYDVINLSRIENDPRLESDILLTKEILLELNYIKSMNILVKILWDWDFSKKINFKWIDSFSKLAKSKIEKNWGKID